MNSISVIQSQQPVPIEDVPLWADLITGLVKAGFPSPAEDLGAQRIDLTQLLFTHPQATYLLRASGQSMVDAGIFDKDILVVNRALVPRNNQIVVAVVDNEFTVKRLYQRAGRIRLKAANPTYPDIVPKGDQELTIWGVVTATIKQFSH